MQVMFLHRSRDLTIRDAGGKGRKETIRGHSSAQGSPFLPAARVGAATEVREAAGPGKGNWGSAFPTRSRGPLWVLERILGASEEAFRELPVFQEVCPSD